MPAPMGKIALLDGAVVNQIAAGEVIERPASVVKELLENALDAGARRVRVEVEGAGLTLIRVLDDGEGMPEEDLPLALERHATSKVRRLSDLESISTLGFRGEALPSIAAVSRLRLLSRSRGAAVGAEIEARGGRPGAARPSAHPAGTLVEVRDLFFNTPARRKFLRSPAGEARAITALISQFAVAYPAVHFVHLHDGRTLLEAPPVRSLRERLSQVMGPGMAERLLDIEEVAADGAAVRGLISDAEGARGNRTGQWLYVNLRLVHDRALGHALQEASSEFIPKGRHATAFVFLSVPAAQVDVNVHPAKWEVRFARPDAVRALVFRAVREAARSRLAFRGAPAPEAMHGPPSEPAGSGWTPAAGAGAALTRERHACVIREPLVTGFPPAAYETPRGEEREPVARPLPLGGEGLEDLRPLAQYRESFIIATDGRDLLIVDQHVAHERILYERILREWEEGKVERQPMLLPLPVTLSPEESVTLDAVRPLLEEAGFRIDPFGEREVILREAPVMAGMENTETLVHSLLEEGEEVRRGRPAAGLRDRLAARCACHAAIKIHTPLSRDKMEFLLHELLRTRTPFLCPHGRPIVLRLTDRALERTFGRC